MQQNSFWIQTQEHLNIVKSSSGGFMASFFQQWRCHYWSSWCSDVEIP